MKAIGTNILGVNNFIWNVGIFYKHAHTHIDSRSTGIMPVSLQKTLRNSLFLESSLGLFNIVILVDPKSVLFKSFFAAGPLLQLGSRGSVLVFIIPGNPHKKKKHCMSSSFVDHFIVISHYSITMISTISIAISFLGGL